MKLKDLQIGQIVEVTAGYSSPRLAQIVEIGNYTKTVYRGRSYRGEKVTQKGARVAFQGYGEAGRGTFPLTKMERSRVWGKPEETYIDPFDGVTVTVPATEDTWTEVEIDATEWVRPQEITGTVEDHTARLKAEAEHEASKARLAEQTKNLDPCVREVLKDAGISEYRASSYAGGKVELSYSEFMKIVDMLDPEGTRR